MKLLAFHFSGKASETQTFKVKLQMLSQIRGEQPPKVGTNQFSCDGLFMPVQETESVLMRWFVYASQFKASSTAVLQL